MPVHVSSRPIFKSVAPFEPVQNFSVVYWPGGGTTSQWGPGALESFLDPTYLLEAKNNGSDKYISHPMPAEGQNPSVSTLWEFWVKLNDFNNDEVWFIIANQPNLNPADAAIRGYAWRNDPGNQMELRRLNGGGATTLLGGGWDIIDNNIHRIRLTREVSGANRFWRMYDDDMTQIDVGPENDTTYTAFWWWGWWVPLAALRVQVGAEVCQS